MRGDILVLSDDPTAWEELGGRLTRQGFAVSLRPHTTEVAALLQGRRHDAIALDLGADPGPGLRLCARLRATLPGCALVLLSRSRALRDIVAAFRSGAHELFVAPFALDEVERTLAGAAEAAGRQAAAPPQELLGECGAVRRARALIDQVADTDAPVLISGETGTGKELLARCLHERGARRGRPFLTVPCASQPEAALEREIFGHVRGAFPGAARGMPGGLARAAAGTVFFDEIGAIPPGLQGKLLRALQERRIRPVGGVREEPLSARVVAASRHDPARLLADGRLREDLFFHLGVIRAELPPLRERGEDVLVLARSFLLHFAWRAGKAISEISPDAAARLRGHSWPGNVRELRGGMERAVALCRGAAILEEDLPPLRGGPARAGRDLAVLPLREVERRHIEAVLDAVAGNRTAAARLLGLDRKTLQRKLARRRLAGR